MAIDKLEIGPGDHPQPGFVGLDLRPGKAAYTGSAENLPFSDGSIGEIYAAHIIEHVHIDDVNRTLVHWCVKLKPGGKLHIVCPNLTWLCREILAQPIGEHYDFMVRHLTGMQDYPENTHYSAFTVEDLLKRLTHAGFEILEDCPTNAIHVDVVCRRPYDGRC